MAQGRIGDAERLATLACQQYLRSDYQWTVLILAPALVAGRAFAGEADRAREAIEMIGLKGVDTGLLDLAGRAILGDLAGTPPPLTDQQPAGPSQPYNLFDLASAALQVEVCDLTDDPTPGPGRARPARSGPCGRLRARHRVGGIRAPAPRSGLPVFGALRPGGEVRSSTPSPRPVGPRPPRNRPGPS